MSTLITRQIEFDMGHRIPNHSSKCRNIHGHRYRLEVGVRGDLDQTPGDPSEGMVLDYSCLKQLMMHHVHDPLDHGFMIANEDPFLEVVRSLKDQKLIEVPFIPTAENIVQFCFNALEGHLKSNRFVLDHCRLWETPNCSATYRKKN